MRNFSYTNTNTHDASLILWIERQRDQILSQTGKRDCYLISSDKSLRYWDLSREKGGSPIVIYPSHFFAILIKACGRAKNDLRSFVSFINLRPKTTILSPEKADAILSGISVVTEDLITQDTLLNELMKDGFNDILKDDNGEIEIYERTKLYSMKYLENKFKEQNQDLEVAKKQIAAVAERVIDLERQNKTNIENGNDLVNKNKKLQKTIFDISKQSTRFRYIINWWIKPLVFMLYTILVCSFITLQFLFANAKWNLVPILLKYISTKTIIGKGEGFTLVVLDGVLFFVLRVLYKKLMKNPFNRLKRTEYRKELIEKHIENNWPQEEQFDQEWLSAMEKHA